jgi:3-oxoacyl-[acyl-carrier protein] reductase
MEPVNLDGRVAIITGASRGMGREIAIAYAKAGAKGIAITAAAASDEAKGEIENELADVVAEIDDAGGTGTGFGIYADATSWDDCQRVVAETVGKFGNLDILYHNAGKSQRYHGDRDIPFWETDHEGWRLVMDTNVIGPYLMAKAAIPKMLDGGWGRVVVTTKNSDSMHSEFAGAYGPSKAAVEAQAISWAEETVGTGVTVNTLSPGGAVRTKFGRGLVQDRGLQPDVIVPMALWLASTESDDVTGCRFDAKFWDNGLSNAAAAEGCRLVSLFPTARRETKLTLAWAPSDVID